jgi:hypothetical protein
MRLVHLCALLFVAGGWLACTDSEPAPPAVDAAPARAQRAVTPNPSTDLAYVCPMDRDVRSNDPGKCPRCGMELVAGVPDPTEYRMDLTVTPKPPRPGQQVRLTFEVFDPWNNRRVEKFTVVHEKLFHAFIVSRDLQFFVHDHPVWDHGSFHYDLTFPKPGLYRVLGDFYPEAAAPQLITDTIFIAGTEDRAVTPLAGDYSTKQTENMKVEFSTAPAAAIAGVTTQMRIAVAPGDGLEKYLGAWGHMLVASEDLIDMIHTHPLIADGSSELQFSLVFPRPGVYRVWVQLQRNGVVNTAHFDVPVIN